jgi:hypothetical protein
MDQRTLRDQATVATLREPGQECNIWMARTVEGWVMQGAVVAQKRCWLGKKFAHARGAPPESRYENS